jgi:hypothetical protein
MKQMVEHIPGSYAPVTILIDERSDAVHLSYDTTGSILAPYGSSIASNIAKNLDEKIKALLEATANERLDRPMLLSGRAAPVNNRRGP